MHVYIARAADRFKIGKARDVEARIAELQVGCPFEMHILGVIDCASDAHALEVERQLHLIFAREAIRGEWFFYNSRARDAVNAVLKCSASQMWEAARNAFKAHPQSQPRNRSAERHSRVLDREFKERFN